MNPEASSALGERARQGGRGEAGYEGRLQLERDYEEAGRTTATPDLLEFAGAFVVGALVGAGLMLLLRPRRKSRTERIRDDLAPYRKKMRESAQHARRSFKEGADATTEIAEALGQAGRTLIQGLREEIGDMIGSAREELSRTINDQVGQAMAVVRRGNRHKGWR